jgi:hypothetical protein
LNPALSYRNALTDPVFQAEAVKLCPKLRGRFRQVNHFRPKGHKCSWFLSTLKLCKHDLAAAGFKLFKGEITTPDGVKLWPRRSPTRRRRRKTSP